MFIEFRYLLGMQKSTLEIWERVAWWETQQRNHGGRGRLSLRDGHLDADLEVGGGLQDEGAAWVNEHTMIGERGCRTEPGYRRGGATGSHQGCALLGNSGFTQGVWEALEKL